MSSGNGSNGNGGADKRPLRCAVYVRQSVSDAEEAYSSLDAQTEACSSYIGSQRSQGWIEVPERFADPGRTGANMERPALRRLMEAVERGEVNVIVVYKIDRLSRSLADFARIMEVFNRRNVAFVSVTQQFNTATSVGKFTLNMLFSFAEFERAMISERTRDKVVAARRRGRWCGGFIPYGYDLLRNEKRLTVNEKEAEIVREIYGLFLKLQSLTALVTELNRRGWTTKRWTTQDGKDWGGQDWSKGTVFRLLTNRTYVGMVRHGKDYYKAEHPGIIDAALFSKVQQSLGHGKKHGPHRNSFGYLLRGLVFCKACGSAMTPATTKKKRASYRYYKCTKISRMGTDACAVRYAPAEPLEAFVVDHLRRLGREPALVEETLQEAHKQVKGAITALAVERKRLEMESRRIQAEARRVLSSKATGSLATGHLAELEERQGRIASRLAEIEAESRKLSEAHIDPEKAKEALAMFDPVWEVLEPRERERLVRLVVQRVDYHGLDGDIVFIFQTLGLKSLVAEAEEVA